MIINDVFKENQWIDSQRIMVEEYLEKQNVKHLGVCEYPAFHFYPYLALWAVKSIQTPGSIGWWAISGDLPTDYISSSEGRHPRKALATFAHHWLEYVEYLLRGDEHPEIVIGPREKGAEFGQLLKCRAEIIQGYAEDDELWEEESGEQ